MSCFYHEVKGEREPIVESLAALVSDSGIQEYREHFKLGCLLNTRNTSCLIGVKRR